MRDLQPLLTRVKIARSTPNDEIVAHVREAADWMDKTAKQLPISPTLAANVSGVKLAYAADAPPDPYAGFEARIVPENVTLLPKTKSEATGGNAFNEKVV